MFDWKKPTVQMLGRWQPFHDGHYALFEKIIKKTGQVCIQIRDVQGVDDNPFDFETVKKKIEERLNPKYEGRFKIVLVPNITNICYGRGVGYKIEEIVLDEETQKISATKIRAKMREDGYAVEAGENDTLIVQKLTSNPNAYGFFGYSYLVANKDKVKAAAINGVQPSLEGIQDYSYPIARPLFFYVKKAHIGVIPGMEEDLKEFTSKKAMGNRGYLAKIGLVPLASDKYKVTRTAALDLKTISIK